MAKRKIFASIGIVLMIAISDAAVTVYTLAFLDLRGMSLASELDLHATADDVPKNYIEKRLRDYGDLDSILMATTTVSTLLKVFVGYLLLSIVFPPRRSQEENE